MISEAEIKRLRKQLADLNRKFQENGMDIDEEVEEKLDDYRQMLRDRSQEALKMMKERGKKVDDFVHENPWQSVGMAFGVGVIIGIILKMFKDR